MRHHGGIAGPGDLIVLGIAVSGFTLFFGTLAGAAVVREGDLRSEHLQGLADSLLASALDDPRWTREHALLVAEALENRSSADFAGPAVGHPFRVLVIDLATDRRWTFGGDVLGTRRTATGIGNVLAEAVHPARISATVGE